MHQPLRLVPLPLALIAALVACTPRSNLPPGGGGTDGSTTDVADTGANPSDTPEGDVPAVDVVSPDDAPADAGEEAAVDAPADEAALDGPAVDTPAVDVLALDTPAVDTPAVDTPSVDTPAADVPALTCRSDRDCSARNQVCERTRGVCVDCNTSVDCPTGEVCSGNLCMTAPPPCRSSRECSARMQVCHPTRMICVDCATDVDCPTGRVCDTDGNCAAQTCAPGSASCADESTRRVCSSDGRSFATMACPAVPNGVSRCADGTCVPSCAANFADCDTNPANGCESDLRVNISHCGRCGGACSTAGGVAGCNAGVCSITCSAGRGDCDGMAATGCETNVTSSNAHCGRCGNACPQGQSCNNGVCGTTGCPTGQTLCGGACVDLNSSAAHCGRCGNACALSNATSVCTAGTCVVQSCAALFGNCDGVASNGCETQVDTNLAHCGTCNRTCSAPSAITVCNAGNCTINMCLAGFGNCDGNPVTGCETDTRTSAAHCGACNRACASGQACQAGTCVTNTCPSGQTLCTGGVCRNLSNDAANCGACGRACATGQVCSAGTCSSTPLRFVLTWNITADLDLAVVTPTNRLINYANPTNDGGSFGTDSMATGPEQISWTTVSPPSGTYSVCVIPFRVTSTTSYTLQIYRAGTLVNTRTGSWASSAASGTSCSTTSSYRVTTYAY